MMCVRLGSLWLSAKQHDQHSICFLWAMGCIGQPTCVHRTSLYSLHRHQHALEHHSTSQKSKEHLSFEVLPVCITHLSSLKCSARYLQQCKSQLSAAPLCLKTKVCSTNSFTIFITFKAVQNALSHLRELEFLPFYLHFYLTWKK